MEGVNPISATARIMSIEPDPRRDDHDYAYVEDYLEFDRPVPFRESGFYYERGPQKADGSANKGSFGRSVRLLEDSEYRLILAAGFEAGADERGRLGIREGVRGDTGGLELVDRPIIELRIPTMPITDSGACRSPPEKRSSIAALGHSGLGLYRTRFSGPDRRHVFGTPRSGPRSVGVSLRAPVTPSLVLLELTGGSN